VPAGVEIIVEPGRTFAVGAGFACGRVCAARGLGDRELRVVDVSRACHLRWSQPELVGYPPRPGEGRGVLFVGPTCYEEDVVGEWTVDPSQWPIGARVVLRDVTGYAVGWNTGFGGVPPADVVMA
jgi:diaminopimelate decarboxylase